MHIYVRIILKTHINLDIYNLKSRRKNNNQI